MANGGNAQDTGEEDADTRFNHAALLQKQGKLEAAIKEYLDLLKIHGFLPDVSYNLASAFTELRQYDQSLKYIGLIIENGIRDFPEFNVGMITEGVDVRTVSNSEKLHASHLIEAFNLKASIEYRLKNCNLQRLSLYIYTKVYCCR